MLGVGKEGGRAALLLLLFRLQACARADHTWPKKVRLEPTFVEGLASTHSEAYLSLPQHAPGREAKLWSCCCLRFLSPRPKRPH